MALIDKDSLMGNLQKAKATALRCGYGGDAMMLNALIGIVENEKEVDPAEHGEWKKMGEMWYACSICGNEEVTDGDNYCRVCGAKMSEKLISN